MREHEQRITIAATGSYRQVPVCTFLVESADDGKTDRVKPS
jgi:hypothetical protein